MTRPASQHSEIDLLVLGGGAAGMTAALAATVLGLDVLLVEKTAVVGGTTAISVGSVWVPGSHHRPSGKAPGCCAPTARRSTVGTRAATTWIR